MRKHRNDYRTSWLLYTCHYKTNFFSYGRCGELPTTRHGERVWCQVIPRMFVVGEVAIGRVLLREFPSICQNYFTNF